MSKKMLIDDTHKEETRVVIINGNRLEDVEFETSSRKQIKGNVYLAKVMRVEPSLQAAFVDYGGNRHGFLAFSEIHPDYYQISEEEAAKLDKEAEEAIEAKKHAIKGREIEKEKQREERQTKRETFLREKTEETSAEKSETPKDEPAKNEVKAQAGAKFAKKTRRKNKYEVIKTEETGTNETVKEEISAESVKKEDTAEKKAVNEEVSAEKNNEENKPIKKRLAKKHFKKKTGEKTEKLKVLAESAGTQEDCIFETIDNTPADENVENIVGEEFDDEDDDFDDDFELQKKLFKVKKLYHAHNIKDVIKEGQTLLVQVVKEERGNKGAALTTYLSLAGRYCVLMPNRIKSGGISRKITNANDRKKLKSIIRELPLSYEMSLIVRTAGEDKNKPDIVRDYNYLIRSWNQIRIESLKKQPPALIHEEGNLIKRALRDMYTKDISEIIVDGEKAYKTAKDFTRILSPQNLKKIKTTKKGDIPLFQRFQVETQLDKLHDMNVQLESGGYLVINPTEALVAIDVNSGRATKEKDLEETALKTNLEAADEIARQLRMRNLAGLIVIDFIDMEEPKNNQAVEKRIKEALKTDRARIQIGKMSCFGLLEISRQRLHSSFFENSYQTCPHCRGKGIIRTIESSAILVLRDIEEECTKNNSARLNVFVPTDVAVYILNYKRKIICDLEQRYNISVIISADDKIKNISDYKIERVKQVKTSKPETESEASTEETEENLADFYEEKPSEHRDRGNRRDNRRNRRSRYDRGNRYNKYENNRNKNAVSDNENTSENTDEKKSKSSWWKKLIR